MKIVINIDKLDMNETKGYSWPQFFLHKVSERFSNFFYAM